MKKIITYINYKFVKSVKTELQKIGLAEITVTKYQVPIEYNTSIEFYCDGICVNKVKSIFNEATNNDEWNEKMFFVEDINFDDKAFMFIKG